MAPFTTVAGQFGNELGVLFDGAVVPIGSAKRSLRAFGSVRRCSSRTLSTPDQVLGPSGPIFGMATAYQGTLK
jgi:hypothetical protein